MRILYLTAGTGGFFCGACLRDNALVHALRRIGHEVHMMPLYLPTIVEGEDAADCPLFLGGINIWLQDKVSLFRHTPRFIDKLFDSGALLKMAGQRSGMTDAKVLGHMTVSTLKGLDGTQKKEIRRMQKWLRENIEVDLICVSNLMLLGLGPALKEVYDVPLLATMQSEESFLDALPEPYKAEAWSLLTEHCKLVAGFIGISHFHARLMEERLQLARNKIYVVYNGIDTSEFAPAKQRPDQFEIGYLSRIHPSKGLHTLVDAFIVLHDNIPNARLRIVGSKTKSDEAYIAQQQKKLADLNLTDRVTWSFNVSKEEKVQELQKMSVVSVPTSYPEGFGLYILEALACAVPLMLPSKGSFLELLGDTEGGVIYEVKKGEHEVDVLAQHLKDYADEEAKLQEMGEQGREAVFNRYDIDSMAAGISEAFQDIIGAAHGQ